MILTEGDVKKDTIQSVMLSDSTQKSHFMIKCIVSEKEKAQAFHLRHKIFCDELQWVQPSQNGQESDVHDNNAIFFGLFNEEIKLQAFLRLILSEETFMIENEFSSLIGQKYKIRKCNDTAEVSRLCVSPEARCQADFGNFGIHNISMLLFKGLYHWCIRNKIRYLYFVVNHKIYRLLSQKGFPCELIGCPQNTSKGILAAAVMMDWKKFELVNALKRPVLFEWFKQIS